MADLFKRATKEAKRKMAIKLLKKGWKQAKIAELLDVSQGSISHWKKAFEQGGFEELKSTPQTGRTPRLNDSQRKELKGAIEAGAEAAGFTGNFWTQKRVSKLIEAKFSVKVKTSSMREHPKKLLQKGETFKRITKRQLSSYLDRVLTIIYFQMY